MKKVSVILDNYNYDKYIGEAIQSVIDQTYENWELLIVDDGSTDNSREIIESYAKKYPEKIKAFFQENGGQAKAFNTGWENATGDIIAFLDSDDYWFPEKLFRIVPLHEEYGIVQHRQKVSGDIMPYFLLNNNLDLHKIFIETGFDAFNMPASALSVRKDILDEVFPLKVWEEYKICADYCVFIGSLYYSNIYNINENLSFYRQHGENLYFKKSHSSDANNEKRSNMFKEYRMEFENKIEARGEFWIREKEYENSFSNFLKIVITPDFLGVNHRILIYGTGGFGISMTKVINSIPDYSVVYYGKSQVKEGETFLEREVLSPKEISEKRDEFDAILICSAYYEDILKTLKEFKLIDKVSIMPFQWGYEK